MIQFLDPLPIMTFIAFAMTYLLHSTIWILMVAFLVNTRFFQTPLLKNFLWKAALMGGLTTSIFASFSGSSLFEIALQKNHETKNIIVENIHQTATNFGEPLLLNPNIHKEVLSAPESVIKPVVENFNWHSVLPFVLIFWITISFLLLLKISLDHWFYFRKINPRILVQHSFTFELLKRIQEKSKVSSNLKLSQSETLHSPILIRNKEVCLPEKAIVEMKEEELEAMLAHEVAHVVRKDYYWTCAISFLEVFFFFQPLHAWVRKEINNTNELLCDEWAAQITGNNLALAQCLLTVATWIKKEPQNYALVAGMSLKKSELSNRVQSLIQFSSNKQSRFNGLKLGLLYTALLAMALFVLPGFTFTDKIQAEAIYIENSSLDKSLEEEQVFHEVEKEEESSDKVAKSTTKKNPCGSKKKDQIENHSPKKKSCSLLLAAVRNNDLVLAKQLLKTTNPDCLSCSSISPSAPINAAARNENLPMIQLLLDAGAYIYNRSNKDEGAILAVAKNGNIPIMKLFDAEGAHFDFEFEGYGSALTTAIRNNQYNMVRYLLNNHADPTVAMKDGKTGMDYAKEKGGKMWQLVASHSDSNLSLNN